jgi:hypothetical protein
MIPCPVKQQVMAQSPDINGLVADAAVRDLFQSFSPETDDTQPTASYVPQVSQQQQQQQQRAFAASYAMQGPQIRQGILQSPGSYPATALMEDKPSGSTLGDAATASMATAATATPLQGLFTGMAAASTGAEAVEKLRESTLGASLGLRGGKLRKTKDQTEAQAAVRDRALAKDRLRAEDMAHVEATPDPPILLIHGGAQGGWVWSYPNDENGAPRGVAGLLEDAGARPCLLHACMHSTCCNRCCSRALQAKHGMESRFFARHHVVLMVLACCCALHNLVGSHSLGAALSPCRSSFPAWGS